MLSGVMRYYRSGRTALITASRAQNKGYSSGQKKKTAKCEEKLRRGVHIEPTKNKKKKLPQSTSTVGGHRPSRAGQVVHTQHARILAQQSSHRTVPTTTTTNTATVSTRYRGLLVLQRNAAAHDAGTRRVRRCPARRCPEALDAAQPGVTALWYDPVNRDAPNGAVAPLASGAAPRMSNAKRLSARSPLRLRLQNFDRGSRSALPFYDRPCVGWSW